MRPKCLHTWVTENVPEAVDASPTKDRKSMPRSCRFETEVYPHMGHAKRSRDSGTLKEYSITGCLLCGNAASGFLSNGWAAFGRLPIFCQSSIQTESCVQAMSRSDSTAIGKTLREDKRTAVYKGGCFRRLTETMLQVKLYLIRSKFV